MRFSKSTAASAAISLLALSSSLTAQGSESYAPYPAVGQVNSNNVWPYSTSPMRYQQIHDAWSFSSQLATLVRSITYRPSNESRYLNQPAATVEIRVDLALAASGITSKNPVQVMDNNMDSGTRKTVIARKKFNYPGSGTTQEELKIFDIEFKFDSPNFFLYQPAAGRSLVVETRQYARSGGYAFDFVSSTTVAGNGFAWPNGSYAGCPSAGNTIPIFEGDATKLTVGGTFDFVGTYDKQNVIAVFTLGAQNLQATLPGTKCILTNDILWLTGGATDASNQFRVTFPMPASASFAEFRFYCQMAFLESGANSLGIVTSRGLYNVVGAGTRPDLGIRRIWGRNQDPDSIVNSQSSAANGLVTRFAP